MIFFADDDLDDLQLFEEVTQILGIASRSFLNGENLLENLHLAKVVFLDMNMPKKSGLEYLEEIRQHEKFANLPIVIFTTSSEPGLIADAQKLGASLFIKKPSDFNELKTTVKLASDPEFYFPGQPFVFNIKEY